MSKNGIIVNEWENLTALSNRRLNVQNMYTPLKMQWSIDRITIVGKLKEDGWQLLDQYEENIAYIEILKWQDGKGRIDFNPNKIGHFFS